MRIAIFFAVGLCAWLAPAVQADASPRGHGPRAHITRDARHASRGHFHERSARHRHHHTHLHRRAPHFHGGGSYHRYPAFYPRSFYATGIGFYGDDFSYRNRSGNYATNGLWLGALAGAMIGNNSGDLHHNAWLGAGLGAAAGYIAGTIADTRAERNTILETQPAPSVTDAPQAVARPASQQVAEPSPQGSSMAAANRLFGR